MQELAPTNIFPYFIGSGIFILVAFVIHQLNPFYRTLTNHNEQQVLTLDGLRGFLALGVFFHHAIINHNYFLTSVWKTPDSTFYTLTGQLGVSLFFAITAFLFWSRVIKSEGSLNWKSFYRSRFQRILPMYFLTVLILILIITYKELTNQTQIFNNFSQTLAIAKQLLKFIFFSTPSIPVENFYTVNAGVYWTLVWEWKFYLALPLLSVSLPSKKGKLLTILLFALFCISSDEKYLYYFLVGILAAEFYRKKFSITKQCKIILDLCSLLLFFVIFYFFDTAYGIKQALVSFFLFICLLYGNGLFGVLHTKPARLLGEISYSIYLLHGLVISFVISFLPNPLFYTKHYWPITLSMGCLTIILSSMSYQYIERYFYKKPKNNESKL
jgi:peptidoglycan/LPS O-acetylase OafA/YrhL